MVYGNNILDFLSPIEFRDYARARVFKPYVGEELFPNSEKIDALKISYIVGADNKPVVAKASAFNAEAEIGSRDGLEAKEIELFKIQKQYRMDERELRVFLNNEGNDARKMAASRLFDDGVTLYEEIRANIQLMRMQLLANGMLTQPVFDPITKNDAVVDYQVPTENKFARSKFAKAWTDPTADIIGDLQMLSFVADERPLKAMTSRKIFNAILKNNGIQKALFGDSGGLRLVTRELLNSLLLSLELPQIVVNEDTYRVQNDKKAKNQLSRFFPENKFVLYPEGALGEMLYAITSEELVLNKTGVEYNENDNILIYAQPATNDIINWYTKGCTIAAPTFPKASVVVQAIVI
jgi:hypothetical protein